MIMIQEIVIYHIPPHLHKMSHSTTVTTWGENSLDPYEYVWDTTWLVKVGNVVEDSPNG